MSPEHRPLVAALGVFPPPVTGMSLCTERVASRLEECCEVVRFNLSDDSKSVTWRFRVNKLLRMAGALLRMAWQRRLRDATLYMPLNAAGAMYYNLAAALVARLRGWRTVVHHHVYLYLRNYDWRVRALDRLMGAHGLHLLLCPDMQRRLVELYGVRAPCAFVPSTIMLSAGSHASEPLEAPPEPRPLRRLGHISNLSEAKGALLAIRTLARLRDEGRDVELVMAGPSMEASVERGIAEAQKAYGASFDYRGPVYGAEKERFFRDIDVLLFPSTFRLEAQPIVLSEAFAYGKPVLTFGISCIPSLVAEASWHVRPQDDFVEFAAQRIKAWQDEPSAFAAAQRCALERAGQLVKEAELALVRLADWVVRRSPQEFVVQREDLPEPTPC